MAKPNTYTDEITTEICRRLSEGTPLAVMCREEGFPAVRTVTDWRKKYPEFDKAYAEARLDGFDAIAVDCLEIADDGSRDYVEESDGHGGKRIVVDHDHIQRSKLRVDTRLKLLAKWDPRYADKVDLNHSGKIGFALNVHRRKPAE